ncbi:hypothetical protein L9F63_024485, partial [Diploptera punctata]
LQLISVTTYFRCLLDRVTTYFRCLLDRVGHNLKFLVPRYNLFSVTTYFRKFLVPRDSTIYKFYCIYIYFFL